MTSRGLQTFRRQTATRVTWPHLHGPEFGNCALVLFGNPLLVVLVLARGIAPDEIDDFFIADVNYAHAVEREMEQTNLNTWSHPSAWL